MFKKTAYLLMILSILAAGCSAAKTSNQSSGSSPDSFYEEPSAAPVEGSYSQGIDNSAQAAERMVITNADIEIAVSNPIESMDRVSAMAVEMNGYVVSARQYITVVSSGAEVPQGEVTIRVPAERFNDAMDHIKTETDRPVIREETTSQDVTSEYTDLGSRLRNLEAAEAQLVEIMDEAADTDDVLSVYNQLVSVREQIEVIKGQMQYYEQSAALSSIRVELVANEAVQPLTIGSWQPEGIAKQAIQSLLNAVKFFASATIWIVLFVLPVVILLLIPVSLIFFIARSVYRRSRRTHLPAAKA